MRNDDRNTLVDQHYVAKRLGCHPSTLNRMVKAGRFPEPIRFVENGFPRWPRGAVDDWFEAQRTKLAAVEPKPTPRRGPKPGKGWRHAP